MTNKYQLIELYCAVCRYYDTILAAEAQRFSNNFCPKFTDVECMTTYIWGIIQQKFDVKSVYTYIKNYYGDWFPDLPSYQAYNKRICYLCDAFKALAGILLKNNNFDPFIFDYLIDSMPIIVAGSKRSSTAKVASEICDKGYCSSKGMYYYGVKLHALAQSNPRSLPIASSVTVTAASENDSPVGKRMLDDTHDINVFADKMYHDNQWKQRLQQESNVSVLTPVKLKKGQDTLRYMDRVFSTFVSSVRQPIESFFNWLQEKTHIHLASKVRSANGLFSFIFARIALACFKFNY